jgi:N-acetylglucosaminyldiphosphoundecaprenol N-acetyl-beta-D-mannosaminyltransferase
MINLNSRTELFNYNIYSGTSIDLMQEIEETIACDGKIDLLSLNTLKLYLGAKKTELFEIFQNASHVIPDGQSIVFSLRLLRNIKIEAISGAELMLELIKLSAIKNYSIFFLGSPNALLEKVKLKIQSNYPSLKSVEFQHGFFDIEKEHEVVSKISEFKPNLLFIAFGSPRKEEFMQKYADELNCNIVMGVGGSYEIFVGQKKLDKLTKKLGLRWLIRALQDPLRLFPRYAKCNTYFLFLVVKEILKKYKIYDFAKK